MVLKMSAPGITEAETGAGITNTEDPGSLQSGKLKYLQRPPTIVPNYGRKKQSLLPKSSISRVLLYDNVMQQQMLEVKLNNLKLEKKRTGKILDLHRKSFLLRQSHKQHLLQRKTAPSNSLLPDLVKRQLSSSGGRRGQKLKDSTKRSRSFPGDSGNNEQNIVDQFALSGEEKPMDRKSDFTELPDIHMTGLGSAQVDRQLSNGITKYLMLQTAQEQGGGIQQDDIPSSEREDALMGPPQDDGAGDTQVNQTATNDGMVAVDNRFLSLKNTLQQIDHHSEGYAELSPSFKRNYVKIPTYLISM